MIAKTGYVCRILCVTAAVFILVVPSAHAGFISVDGGTTKYFADFSDSPPFNSGANAEREALDTYIGGGDLLQDNRYRTTEESGFTHNTSYKTTNIIDLENGNTGLNGEIQYEGGNFISYQSMWLYVKDGNNQPWYAFDLGVNGLNWNGTDTIGMYDFYTTQGNISHASIFSGGDYTGDNASGVPEPASVAVWLIAVIGGMFLFRDRRRRSVVSA